MKSKVILFCVLLFCSKIVGANPHSEDLRQRVKPSLNWQVDQNTQDAQFFNSDFTQTRNVNPISVIQQDSIQDYDSNQERYTSNYDGYGYNKSPVASPSGKQLLGNYNTQIDGRRLESYPPRVESYPPQVGFDQQLRNPNWRSQNPYTNSAPSGVLITDSEMPLVNTVQESYRAPVQYPQPKYVPSSNRGFYPPNRPPLRREQFKNPLADDTGDGKYVANSAHRFGSSGPVPYENFNEGQAGTSEIKTRFGQRYLHNLASQSGNIYSKVPAVIGDTLAAQSENIKFLENYSAASDLMNTGPSTNYDGGSPVMSEVENYNLDSRSINSPVSYESYNNGPAASDMTARLTGVQRQTQGFAPQSGIGYKESPAVIFTDALENQRIDRSRSDLSNAANYDDDVSPDNYSSGSRLSDVRVPYEIYGESQTPASEVKQKSIGGRKYAQNIAPQSRLMYNNIPAVTATDIVADQSKTIREYENREKNILRSDSDNIVPATNQEDSSTVISAADNTNTDSTASNPTSENIEKKTPVDISKILSHIPSGHRYAHNYKTESESSNIVRDDSYNSASTVISETLEEKSGEKPVPINTYSETSSTSTDTESDVPAHGSNSLIPSNTYLNHLKNLKPSSGISELSLIDLLSKTDIEKFMAGNTKRFLVIHPNKTVEYVDNIETDSHQNSKVRLLKTKPKNVINSEGDGALLLENDKDNPVDESDSNLPIEDLPENYSSLKPLRSHTKQQAGIGRLKSVTPLSKPLTSLVNQAPDDDTPYKPLTLPENYPEENKYSKPLRPNIRHPVHRYESKGTQVNQPAFGNKSNPSFPDGNQLAVDKNLKAQHSNENLPSDENNSKTSSPNENQPSNDNNDLNSKENKSVDDNDFIPSSPRKRWLRHQYNSKLPRKYQENYEYNSKPLSPNENLPENVNNSKSSTLNGNQSRDDSDSNPLSPNEDQSGNDKISKKLFMNENQSEDVVDSKQARSYKRHHKSKPLRIKQSANDDNSNPSYPDQNQPSDDDTPLNSYKTQPIQGNQPNIENNPKQPLSNKNQPGDENDSNSSSPNENQPSNDNNAKTLSPKENKSVDDNDFIPPSPRKRWLGHHYNLKPPHTYQPTNEYNSNPSSPNENQPENENNSKSLTLNGNESEDDSDSNPLSPDEDQSGNDKISKKLLIDENQSDDDVDSKLSRSHKIHPIHRFKSANIDNSNPSYPNQNQPPESQPGDENDSNSSSPSENQPGYDNDSNSSSPSENQSVDESNSNLSSSEENQPEDVNMSNPSYVEEPEFSNANQSEDENTLPENNTGDDNDSDSLTPDYNQLKDDYNAKPSGGKRNHSNPLQPRKRKHKNKRKPYKNQSENDDISPENMPGDDNIDSSSPDENKPEYKKKSKRLRPYEKQPKDDSKPIRPLVSKTDENSDSTTVSPITPDNTALPKLQVAKKHKHKHNRRKSTTSSPIVTSTTPRLEETSDDEMITISPIEQVTDNVRGVSSVTTSTTTAKPIETPGKSDIIKDNNNEQDDNNANSSSEDLDSISTPTENTSGDKTKETIENNNIKTNDKAKNQLSKEKKDIQTVQSAVYNSSELLNTNTDVPAESDIYSSVTTSPSVQNDVNTGDASGDNKLELVQPETDVTITVSSNTDNDSEDDVIIINVEVLESTGSSGNDKSLLISIDTNEDSDDDFETSQATDVAGQSSDCKKDHNDDDGKGKNLEIDMSNIQGEPTMWIRTTNQDFIEKLTEKNDTAFDIVYFFNMVTQPVIEREKETTFYCNGTVVITNKETTYPNKDDSTPKVEKKTQTMQIEEYKRSGLDESSD